MCLLTSFLEYANVCHLNLIFFRYILLKERNRIMTLEAELERQGLYLTDGWRMEKVWKFQLLEFFSLFRRLLIYRLSRNFGENKV